MVWKKGTLGLVWWGVFDGEIEQRKVSKSPWVQSMLGERQAASILAVAAMLHSGRNNNFYISDIFYFLVYQKKEKRMLIRLNVKISIDREYARPRGSRSRKFSL